jgi:hypothetical protein
VCVCVCQRAGWTFILYCALRQSTKRLAYVCRSNRQANCPITHFATDLTPRYAEKAEPGFILRYKICNISTDTFSSVLCLKFLYTGTGFISAVSYRTIPKIKNIFRNFKKSSTLQQISLWFFTHTRWSTRLTLHSIYVNQTPCDRPTIQYLIKILSQSIINNHSSFMIFILHVSACTRLSPARSYSKAYKYADILNIFVNFL